MIISFLSSNYSFSQAQTWARLGSSINGTGANWHAGWSTGISGDGNLVLSEIILGLNIGFIFSIETVFIIFLFKIFFIFFLLITNTNKMFISNEIKKTNFIITNYLYLFLKLQ